MSKIWSNDAQKRYMTMVPKSHREGRTRATKTASDMGVLLTSGQFFVLEDDLAEAYRAGVIDTLMEEK